MMKTRRIIRGTLLLALFLLLGLPYRASAASYTWKSVGDGDMQCYQNGKLVKNQWVGDKHLNAEGYMDRDTWVSKKVDGVSTKVFVRDDGKWVRNFKEGWQKISGQYHYYTAAGKQITGWIKNKNGKVFYVDKSTKARVEGLCRIGGKLYYFASGGAMVSNQKFTYLGRQYEADERGVCTPTGDSSSAPSADMLFFLTFESGSMAYNQTGGDHGNACGAYQFDNRYSLFPFVKYAYGKNPTLCKEFKKFAKYKSGTKLKSNEDFYKAWHKIYARGAEEFASLQDEFARNEYYEPVELSLALAGVDLADRSDIVKGAVFSYSIQHGQQVAVNAVKACKIKDSTTDEKFLKKLYQYRIKCFPAYKSRYNSEYSLALSRLRASS